MTAAFFWDRSGECKNPLTAIDALGGSRAKPNLSSFWTGSSNLDLPANNAILMSGTTDDLQQALGRDIGAGLEAINVQQLMAIWYVRRTAGLSTKTVVSIASVQGYWNLQGNVPEQSGYRWYRLYTGWTMNGGVSLDTLRNDILPDAKGVKAWF
jgi:hypothetical protein